MIAFEMMMRDILAQRTTQHSLPDWNHLREAFVSPASDPSFRVRIVIRIQLQVALNIKQSASP
jgi:hypothetical protein